LSKNFYGRKIATVPFRFDFQGISRRSIRRNHGCPSGHRLDAIQLKCEENQVNLPLLQRKNQMMYSFIGYFEGKQYQSVLSYLIQIRNQTIILILKITIDPAMRIMFMKKNTVIAVVDVVLREKTESRVVASYN
jgi:hypothetical protein